MTQSDSSSDSVVELFIGRRIPLHPPGEESAYGMSGESSSEGEEDSWEVEKIVGERMKDGRRQYQLKWKGWNSSDNTWEDEDNLSCDFLLQAYREQKQGKQPAEAAKPVRAGKNGQVGAAEPPPTKPANRKASRASGQLGTFKLPELSLGKLLPKVEVVRAVVMDGAVGYSMRIGGKSEVVESGDTVRAKYPGELAAFLESRVLAGATFCTGTYPVMPDDALRIWKQSTSDGVGGEQPVDLDPLVGSEDSRLHQSPSIECGEPTATGSGS
jgi:hypothetical protein